MRDDGTLQVVGVVDPHLLGLRSTAIVGIVVEPARLDSVARSLAAFEEVSYLVMNAGMVDKILIAIERGLPFIYSNYDFGKRVIFGHTPFVEPLVMDNKIGLDTGAVFGNKLTCLELPDMIFHSVEA